MFIFRKKHFVYLSKILERVVIIIDIAVKLKYQTVGGQPIMIIRFHQIYLKIEEKN